MEDKIFCIIVTYNAMKWVDRCFESLIESEVPVEIVVVDNLSKDETVSYIRENYPKTHIIENRVNCGFGQANNQGIKYAYEQGATHFFLLNQDAWILKDTISLLLEESKKTDMGIVSPIQVNGKGDSWDLNFFIYSILNERNLSYVSDLFYGKLKSHYCIEYVNAAAWFLPLNTVELVGGFDPIFFQYGEDMNYAHRVHYHGKKLAFVPKSIIHHDRNLYGNKNQYMKRRYTRLFVVEAANINKTLFSIDIIRIKLLLAYITDLSKALIKLRISTFLSLIWDFILFFIMLPRIMRNKKANKQGGKNWL